MPIPIQADLVKALIKSRFGSVDELVVEWEHRIESGRQKRGIPRDRTTIYRWLSKGEMSTKTDEVFGLAALLDVDPISLLRIDRAYVQKEFARERRLFALGTSNGSLLGALWQIYLAADGWPNHALAKTYYARGWASSDFTHPATVVRNVYACVTIGDQSGIEAPRVYHFAYRRVGDSDRMWRPYGSVVAAKENIVLLSESGNYQTATRLADTVAVETYFGPGPAEFRVASLHKFTLMVKTSKGERECVRFGG